MYCRYGDLIKQYAVSVIQILHDILEHHHTCITSPTIDKIFHYFVTLLLNWTLLLLRTPGPVPFSSVDTKLT